MSDTRAQSETSAGGAPSRAARYWAGNLDPQNLERRRGGEISVGADIVFASTPDVEAARAWLLGARAAPRCILDLGAGLGAISFSLARRGTWVLSVDGSLGRMRKLRRRSREAGCEALIAPIVADAEALPFADGTLTAVLTKSVLIHTDLARATAEACRVLSPGGRAAFIEPQLGNPFAWLYRRTLAPKEWKSITRYFDRPAQQATIRRFGSGQVRPFYLFAFLAFAFQFAWPSPRWFKNLLGPLHRFDGWLFARLPWSRSLAWFGVIEVEKQSERED